MANSYYCIVHMIIFFYFFNQALDTFNTAVVSPIYYVMFTTLTIVASVIMFKVSFVAWLIPMGIASLLYFYDSVNCSKQSRLAAFFFFFLNLCFLKPLSQQFYLKCRASFFIHHGLLWINFYLIGTF